MKSRAFVEYAAWLKNVPSSSIAERVNDVLEWTDTKSVASKRLSELSGGTRRRVFLAASSVHQPSVLILDEPTAGLDPLQREQFYVAIRARQESITLISTHLFEDVIALEGTVHIIVAGHQRWVGTLGDLCDGPCTVERLAERFAQVAGPLE